MADNLPELKFDDNLPELQFEGQPTNAIVSSSPDQTSAMKSEASMFPGARLLQDIAAGGLRGAYSTAYAATRPLVSQNILPGGIRASDVSSALLSAMSGGMPTSGPALQAGISRMPTSEQIDFSKIAGIQNPSIMDKLIQRAAEYSPVGIPVAKSIGGIYKFATSKSAQGLAENIIENLGEGKSLTENASDIANSIKNSYTNAKSQAQAFYKPVFDRYGKSNIYNVGIDSPQEFKNLSQNITEDFLPDLKDLHDAFASNSTLDNAHMLQSQLGSKISAMQKSLGKGQLSIRDQAIMQNYQKARSALKNDVSSFLDTVDTTGNMSKLFDLSTQHFAENVGPYINDPNISQIAKGMIENPMKLKKMIPSILSSESVDKIADDLGSDFSNKIIYSELGKIKNITPENIISKIQGLKNSGYEDYINPSLDAQMDLLSNRLSREKMFKKVGSAIGLGALAGTGYDIAKNL